MHKFILLLASLGGLALAENGTGHADLSHFDCGSQQGHVKEELMAAIKDHHSAQTAKGGSAAARAAMLARDSGDIAIDTYFHVVTTNDKAGQFSNWQQMANDQAATLNKAYNPHGISFNLKESELTKNDAWASAKSDSQDIKDMKKALRKGSYASLNIYFHSDLGGGILGTCTMPSAIGGGSSSDYNTDGCSVNAGTMPGGSQLGFNQGMTAVHETGHWMGLLHTFEGNSCDGDGDLIDDTRAEAESTDGCPTSPAKNSCPGLDGVDPIHNYMDYSIDSCYEDFTPMQKQRMHNLWGQFRQGK
ncbi:hypothetical protein BKA81DRAFT_33614 [Phyllosticta paracitricarpa]